MTTQNVGSSDVKGFDPEEAERLASLIRPAWEDDEVGLLADDAPDAAPAVEAAPAAAATADAKAFEAAIDEKTVVAPPPAPSAGASKSTDTMVDSRPPFSDAVRPLPAGPTMLGLGAENATEPAKAPIAAAAVALSEGLQSFDSSPPEKGAAGGVNKSLTRTAHLEATPLQSTSPTSTRSKANQRPSASRADDPVELPVRKSSTGLMLGLGGAAVLLLGLGGYALFGSSSDKKPEPATTTTAKATTEKPAEATKPTAGAKPTEAAPTPATAAAVTASATATAVATATPTAAPTVSEPVPTATARPTTPAPTATAKPTGQKPPPQSTSKPGGIIRDVPF